MGISLVVAVTDGDWFEMLRTEQGLEEVNFWKPSGQGFQALDPGELFLFKLRAPHNCIVGGGVFAYANQMPCSLAWNAFGRANGASSLKQMQTRIAQYRHQNHEGDFDIGCRILTQPFFLDPPEWVPVPSNWSPNIVQFKTYNTGTPEGLQLWESVIDSLSRQSITDQSLPGGRFGKPQLITPRLGQGAFRVMVTDSYARRCAVTQERTLPALEAAHILPYAQGGPHTPQNGLLLRSDIHRLFDEGYVTVTPSLHFEVSRRIREEFENGKHYYNLQGKPIAPPVQAEHRPDIEALSWHNEHCFR